MDEQRAWLKSKKAKQLRLLAAALCISLIATTYPEILGTLSSLAEETLGEADAVSVSRFMELPEQVREQTVPVGTDRSALELPDTLEAYAAVETDSTEEDAEPGDGEDNDGETSDDGGNDGGETPGAGEAGDGQTPEDGEGTDDGQTPDSGEGTDDGQTPDSGEGNGDTETSGGSEEDGDTETSGGSEGAGDTETSGGSEGAGDTETSDGSEGNDGEETSDGSEGNDGEETSDGSEGNDGEETSGDSEENDGVDVQMASDSADNRNATGFHVQTGFFVMPRYASENEQDALTVETLTDTSGNGIGHSAQSGTDTGDGTGEQTGTESGGADDQAVTESDGTDAGDATDPQENHIVIEGVTWESDPAYDKDTRGVYTFTPVLPEGYALWEGVSLPRITVTVGIGMNALIQALIDRIAALPDAQEFMEEEPDIDNWEEEEEAYEEAYEAWMEELYDYTEEALSIQEELESLTQEEQALIPQEALEKLAVWVEIAEQALENRKVTAADTNWCDGNNVFQPWNRHGSLPTNGYYYLTEDMDIDMDMICTIPSGRTVSLCLHGYSVSSEKQTAAIFEVKGTLELYDCKGGGSVSSTATGATGSTVCVYDGGSFSLHGVSMEQTGGEAVVAIVTGGTVNVYEGMISGDNVGIATHTGLSSVYVNVCGGSVYGISSGITINSGSLTVSGGQVGGENSNGVVVANDATATISGGGVTSNHTGVRVESGKLTVSGGTVNGVQIGVKVEGGNLTVSGGSLTSRTDRTVLMEGAGTVTVAGNAKLYNHIYNTGQTPIVASGTGQSGLTTTYKIQYSDGNLANDQVIVQGSTDTEHYQLVSDTYGLAASGGNLVAREKYAVTYHENGGTITDKDKYTGYVYGEGMTLPTPTRTGYTFGGWYTSAALSGSSVKNISKTEQGAKEYWAKWTAGKYTITYSGLDGATLATASKPTQHTYGTATKVGNPTKTGYTFGGWKVNGGTAAKDLTLGATDYDAAITLEATWAANEYKITYSGLTGATLSTRPEKHTYGTATAVGNPTKAGYTFAGWKVNGGSTATKGLTLAATGYTANITLEATWTVNTYTVTFDYQGATGENSKADMTVTYNTTYGTLPNPTKTGYAFKGWFTQAGGNGNQIKSTTAVTITAGQTLYAYWEDETKPDKPVLKNGVTLPTGWTNTQVTIPLTLYDGVGVTELQVSVDSAAYAKVSGFSGGTGTIHFDYAVREGAHTYQFKAKDAADNLSEASTKFTVRLDRVSPAFTQNPALGEETQAGTTIAFASSEDGKAYWLADPANVPNAQEVVEKGSQAGSVTGVIGGAQAKITVTGLTLGTHKVYVALEDAAGNLSAVKEVSFFHKLVLGDGQMKLPVSNLAYGTELPAPQGSITVSDTNSSLDYSYSADGGANWVAADDLPKSVSGYLIPGRYLLKMNYTGDGYTGTKTVSFTVEKKKLMVNQGTLAVVSRNYDGTTAASLQADGKPTLSSGVVNGDDVSLGGTLTARFAVAGPRKNIPVNVTGFRLEGRDAGYYELGNTVITLYATINNADGTPPKEDDDKDNGNGDENDDGSDDDNDDDDNGNDDNGSGNNDSGNNGSGNSGGTGSTEPNGTESRKPGDADGRKPGDSDTNGRKPGGTESRKPGDAGDGDMNGRKPGDTESRKPGDAGDGNTNGRKPGGTESRKPGDAGDGDTNGRKPGGTDSAQAGAGRQVVSAVIGDGRIVTEDGRIDTFTSADLTTACTVLQKYDEGGSPAGAVIVTVVCEEEACTVGVADTAAVANAILTSGQIQLVQDGGTIEIRIHMTDISGNVPQQDQDVIEDAIEKAAGHYPYKFSGLKSGMYVDISVMIRVGEGEWNAITHAEEPVEVVIDIPETLQAEGREYYIIRAHEGKYTFMDDLDDQSDTITIRTDRFSSYAIVFVDTGDAGAAAGTRCGLCHICPTFLEICCFVWLAAFILVMLTLAVVNLLWKKGNEGKKKRKKRRKKNKKRGKGNRL